MKISYDLLNATMMVVILLLLTDGPNSIIPLCVEGRDHDNNADKNRNRPPSSQAPRLTTAPSLFSETSPAPVVKTPNPKRAPHTTKPRGPTLEPIAPPTKNPTPPTAPPPCPNSCGNEATFTFIDYGSQSGVFDASCLSSSAEVAINQCGLTNVKANFFQLYIEATCTVSVSLTGASFTPSIYVLVDTSNVGVCPGNGCASLSAGTQGGTTVSFASNLFYYYVLMIPTDISAGSTYTLQVSCN